jgi:hypothetical protein
MEKDVLVRKEEREGEYCGRKVKKKAVEEGKRQEREEVRR